MKKSKLANHQPCEDYSLTYQDDFKAIAIIADGHGDKRCYRAHYGSKLACYAALEVLKNINIFDDNGLENLSKGIISRWHYLVQEHEKQYPLNGNKNDLFYIYGSTLSIVIITEDKTIVMNIGDGKCMVRFEDDTFVSVIETKDLSPDSLCDQSPTMDIYVFSKLPRCLMLTSDGGGSFQDEAEFINKVETLYCHQRLKFHYQMMGLVDYFSSDDDVSMIWICREEDE